MSSALSIVIAVQHGQRNLEEFLRRLGTLPPSGVELLVCHTDADPDVPRLVEGRSGVRVLRADAGSLIPHLWRDGIRAARHGSVAVTTAHCLPGEGWLERLRSADLGQHAGVGGVFENSDDSGALGWAIFLQRYQPLARPQEARIVQEIAADNAIYRRELLLNHADLLDDGFWEPEFHARFRRAGLTLALDPALVVIHANRYGTLQFFAQRLAHGTHFGLARGRAMSPGKRLLLLLASPLLPLVFLCKILAAARRHPRSRMHLVPSLPWLAFFLTAWGLGEARGYLGSLTKR
jgi:hypothetical protein